MAALTWSSASEAPQPCVWGTARVCPQLVRRAATSERTARGNPATCASALIPPPHPAHLPPTHALPAPRPRSCVINLSPEKARCLSEVYRVLAPGGEMHFSGALGCCNTAARPRGCRGGGLLAPLRRCAEAVPGGAMRFSGPGVPRRGFQFWTPGVPPTSPPTANPAPRRLPRPRARRPADVYCDRRLPEAARTHKVALGECLGGALYVNDFVALCKKVGSWWRAGRGGERWATSLGIGRGWGPAMPGCGGLPALAPPPERWRPPGAARSSGACRKRRRPRLRLPRLLL